MDGAITKIPQRIGEYRILEEVGSGGLGRVFKAINEKNGKTVAVKILHDRFIRNAKFLGIFHRELLIMSSFHHKNIVSYLDSYFEPPNCFIVTEFIEGWSGHAFMKHVKRVPPLVALCVLIDILQGIDHLHLHDTIHSDLSSANFLLDREGRIYVTDFGLSCQAEIEDYKNYMIGTPGYYSPEHITESPIVVQTDLYCAGLLLYEMVVGAKAVPIGHDRHETLAAMKRIDFGRVISPERRIQSALRHLLKLCLNFNPQKRVQSCDELMFRCYEIMKHYRIRYTRHAIRRFLVDTRLVPGPFTGQNQPVYVGMQREIR